MTTEEIEWVGRAADLLYQEANHLPVLDWEPGELRDDVLDETLERTRSGEAFLGSAQLEASSLRGKLRSTLVHRECVLDEAQEGKLRDLIGVHRVDPQFDPGSTDLVAKVEVLVKREFGKPLSGVRREFLTTTLCRGFAGQWPSMSRPDGA